MERARKEAKVDSVRRVVSSLSLDGKRITAELQVEFVRELGQGVAEAIGDQVFAIADGILSEQIVQSQLRLGPAALEQGIVAKLGSTATKIEALRVGRLRLASPPSLPSSSRSVAPGQPRLTPPPGSVGAPPISGARALSSPVMRATAPPLSESQVPSVKPRQSSRPRPASHRPSARSSERPASRSSNRPASRASSRPGARASEHPRGRGSARPAARRSKQPPPMPSARAGFDWTPVIRRVAPFHGRLLRDAAAYALVTVIAGAVGAVDKLAIFEGRSPAKALRQEATACFAAAVYLSSRRAGADHKDAVAFVNAACRSAALVEPPSPTDIGRYISSANPVEELAARMADLMGGDCEAAHFAASLLSCHRTVQERLHDTLSASAS